jgi:NAD dependent epimerase/dehydratase family enzyme
MSGAFNAVAPQHVTHSDFMNVLAAVMKRPVLPVAVPGFVLKAVLGEMSDVILKGSRVSSEKIINSGYRFLFSNLEDALNDIIRD